MSTLEDYRNFLKAVSAVSELGDLVPDDEGLLRFRVDDTYSVNLQYVGVSSKILCFVEMGEIPESAGPAVYRDLLSAGLFGRDTGGGSFALESESNAVVYQYLFDFDPRTLSPEAFVHTLEQILSLVDLWTDRLQSRLASEVADTPMTASGESLLQV